MASVESVEEDTILPSGCWVAAPQWDIEVVVRLAR